LKKEGFESTNLFQVLLSTIKEKEQSSTNRSSSIKDIFIVSFISHFLRDIMNGDTRIIVFFFKFLKK